MHDSLILFEPKSPNVHKGSIYWHGKTYFNNRITKPEISGFYEVLLDSTSKYRRLIELKSFVPIMYYDSENNSWIHMNKKLDISDVKIVGWRIYE